MILRATVVLVAAATALLAAGCGDDDDSSRDFTLAEVVARPPLPGETVGLIGTATVLGPAGFILGDEGGAVFVGTDPHEAEDVEDGDRVRVVGDVARLTQARSIRLAEALNQDDDFATEVATRAAARVNSDQGALYIELIRVDPPGSS
ncbi:MAG: hypothetical protein WD844_00570 [Thermoleophilaceae bacterium]